MTPIRILFLADTHLGFDLPQRPRIDRRRRMRSSIEGRLKELEASESAQMLDKNFESAYRMMSSNHTQLLPEYCVITFQSALCWQCVTTSV